MKLTTLAIRNIKRNFSKYVMYFFTLSFSVFTVYSFRALIQNQYVNAAMTYNVRYRTMLAAFGVIIFVFVMFFLISSNASFIRARKKEISMYSLFGMSNGKIGKLLFTETMFVGLAALVVGIGAGVFFSKLIAMILLDITLAEFTGDIAFTITPQGVYLTAIPFLFIFCVMGLSGLRVISKFELVDLFKAEKVSEGKSKGSILVLILSLTLIGTGYYLAATSGSDVIIGAAIPILILVIVGTYLFFWGGLPKVLSWMKKRKTKYYRGQNLIAVSALAHRMRSIGSTMATIAVLSAVATTAVATGFNLYQNIERNTYGILGYDLYFYGGQEELLDDVFSAFESYDVELIGDYTTERLQVKPKNNILAFDGNVEYYNPEQDYFRVYSQSVCNELLALSRVNSKPIQIKEGEAAYVRSFWSNVPGMTEEIERAIMAEPLQFSNQEIRVTSFLDASFISFGAVHTIVLNDADFTELMAAGDIMGVDSSGEPFDQVTVFKYNNALKAGKFNRKVNQILSGNVGSYRSAYNHYTESLETFGLVCFIGFFMSVVFILMTASLLYFKQIMAAEEERHQYEMLRKIGMDSQVERRVITKRLLPVFFIPLVIGILHSIFAMKTADTIVFSNMIAAENSYLVVLAFSGIMYGIYAIVYGVFYFITKRQYTRIVG